ncbi:MAG: EAL domain-containing protein [Candidatus Dormibacteria bacterium]
MPDVRVLVADDEAVLREALTDLVNASSEMRVVAVVGSADEAIDAARREQPDVALLDVRMPGGGPHAAKGILECSPATRVLALSASGGRETVLEMLRCGASGYLVKGSPPSEIIAGIRQAAAGAAPLSAEIAGDLVDRVRGQLVAETTANAEHQGLLDEVSRAMSGDALQIVVQPIVELSSGRMVGVEALSRFSLEPRRPPNEWFAAAAKVGLRSNLEIEAVRRALVLLGQLPAPMFMAVNVSAETVATPELVEAVAPPAASRLVIEVTEHTPIADYAALHLALTPLRAWGAGMAIDDAGAGHTSLRHFLELSPQFIKLDMALSQRIATDRTARALTVALVSFAQEIDALIIAEGIETAQQQDLICDLGIPLGQGYHLARPGPLEAALELARRVPGE